MSDWSDCPSVVVDGMRVYRSKPGPLLFAGYTGPADPGRRANDPPAPALSRAELERRDRINEIFERADALFAAMDDE